MNLSIPNKILLLALHGLPVNVLFSRRSLVDGYVVTPCTQCDSQIASREREPIPEVCDGSSHWKFDRFPLACLAVSISQGGFRTIHHKKVLSLVARETATLRHILPADAEVGFWIPRRLSDRKRFNVERMTRSRRHLTLRSTVWHGDERPFGARRVRVQSNFPDQIMVRRLCADLAYPKEAASALFIRAHAPWMTPSPDRRKNVCTGMNDTDEGEKQRDSVALAQPAHPYNPASPSRRTQVGGGWTEQRVLDELRNMRTDLKTTTALVEIVYRRRGTLEVAGEFGLTAENLYVSASRLRSHIRAGTGADLHVQEKAA
jgi:hypothetical protein